MCRPLQPTTFSLSVGASAASKSSRRHCRRLGRGGGGAAVGGGVAVGDADGVGSAFGSSSPEQPGHREGDDEQQPDDSGHAVVFAQQTERRLPAVHSASWNHV